MSDGLEPVRHRIVDDRAPVQIVAYERAAGITFTGEEHAEIMRLAKSLVSGPDVRDVAVAPNDAAWDASGVVALRRILRERAE